MPTQSSLKFVLDANLGFPVDSKPWSDILSKAGFTTHESTDLVEIGKMLDSHLPDMAYVPGGDFMTMLLKGNEAYRGLVIGTSKFTGQPSQRTLLVVRKDDAASSITDLEGATYGYMNTSCSSSYFPPAFMLNEVGKRFDTFLKPQEVRGWQPRVDAVVSKSIRATMILEDIYKMTPENFNDTKVIGSYVPSAPSIIIVRRTLDETLTKTLFDELLERRPAWSEVYGAFLPYYFADVQTFYHDLSKLPADLIS